MKNFALTLAVALSLSACSVAASATTTTYYSTDTQGGTLGSTNSIVVSYLGFNNNGAGPAAATYGLALTPPWISFAPENAALRQGWVSYAAGTCIPGNGPSCPTSAPLGDYFYSATFNATAGDTVTLSLLVDDTASVKVNSPYTVSSSNAVTPLGTTTNSDCLTGSPNCYQISSYNISNYIVTGSNTLYFDVKQQVLPATGLNFSITDTTAATPEPSSLMLLGTGVLGVAGMVRRRFAA